MTGKATAMTKATDIKKVCAHPLCQKKAQAEAVHTTWGPIHALQRSIGNQAVQRLFKSGHLQAKLNIGQPHDIYEQEADRVADQVMRMPERKGEGRRVKDEERQGGRQWLADGGLKRDTLQLKPG